LFCFVTFSRDELIFYTGGRRVQRCRDPHRKEMT
jgi:hypothetical protein